jgi:hypothetical protein
MKIRHRIVRPLAAAGAALVLMTPASPPRADKGAEDVSGVWVYEERVDASSCESEIVGVKRGLLLTIEQSPPSKAGESRLVVNTEGPTPYSAYGGRYDLAGAEMRVEATSGKKNILATSSIEGEVETGDGDRMTGTRNVKIVESKKGKPVSSCKVLASFTARRL